MQRHFKEEKTFVMIKPDGIQRSLVGEMIKRFERIGLKISAIKMVKPTPEQVEYHYTIDPEWRIKTGEKSIKAYKDKGQDHPHGDDPIKVTGIILEKLKKYITSGPVVVMVLEGAHAVDIVRKLVGSTEPLSSDVGTIRGDFVLDSYRMSNNDERAVRNLIHASGSVEEAEKEIIHWFSKEEIVDYEHIQEDLLYGTDICYNK